LFIEPFKPLLGNFYVLPLSLGCSFFKAMQDIHYIRDFLQIKYAIPCALVLVSQLVYARSNHLHGLAVRRHLAKLHLIQRITQVALNGCRELSQNFTRISQPYDICRFGDRRI
jgi:hypothetical protein